MTTKKQKVDWKIVCVGMVCLTGAEIFALSQGINGIIFTAYAAIMGAAIGVVIPTPKALMK